jgi:hypothetical protein
MYEKMKLVCTKEGMNVCTNVWMNVWMENCMFEWIKIYVIIVSTKERKNMYVNEGMCMYEENHKCAGMTEWMNDWINKCLNEWMSEWMNEWINEWNIR